MQTSSVSFSGPQNSARPKIQRQASSNVKFGMDFGIDFQNPDFLKGYGVGGSATLLNIGTWELIKLGYRKATGTPSTKENIKSIDAQLKKIKELLDTKRK